MTAGDVAIVLIGVILLVALAGGIYHRYRAPLNTVWLSTIHWQVAPFSWMSETARQLDEWAQGADPAQTSTDELRRASAAAGGWFRWINVVILTPLALIVWVYCDRQRLFRKRFNTRDLLARNMRLFPCIAPALRRNLLKEPLHSGPWAVLQSPTRFAADHGLLLDERGEPVPRPMLLTVDGLVAEDSVLLRGADAPENYRRLCLDRRKAKTVFASQLGEKFAGIAALPPHRRALVAAFLTFARAERAEAQKFLDQLSWTFREPVSPRGEMVLDTTGMDELLARAPIDGGIAERLKPHTSYTTTWMVALLYAARELGGQLPPAEFLWLRPVDRTLWLALQQAGGGTACVEAAGIWAHYEAEGILRGPILVPEVEAAVDGLQEALVRSGWLREEADSL